MALRTSKEYREGLRDGRSVFYRGHRVDNVVDESELRLAINHSALCYDIAESQPELAVARDGSGEYSAFYRVPRSADDLKARGADSITVRGAKCHTSFSANADELIVLPTCAMGPDDADYAVLFAIPANAPGLNIYVSPKKLRRCRSPGPMIPPAPAPT
jgi:4-hydroxybutyryl-CoA dehydratase / vinylacetyl-CoA-Delta-isomerase